MRDHRHRPVIFLSPGTHFTIFRQNVNIVPCMNIFSDKHFFHSRVNG